MDQDWKTDSCYNHSPNPNVRITAIVVLYQRLARQSEAFLSLQAARAAVRPSDLTLKILLYDNTPGGQDPGPLPNGVEYRTAPHNAGLAPAYNWALVRAEEAGDEWLLTLDQDTILPPNFLSRIGAIAAQVAHTPAVAAVVPQIVGRGRILSPNCFWGGGVPCWFPSGFQGVPTKTAYAFNSAALLRVPALRQVGGYSPWFWLDNSDSFIFHQLQLYGKRVFVAGEVQVDHDFSMMDMRTGVSPQRYRNILLAESAFWDMEMNALAGLERTARLLVRFLKHLGRRDSSKLQHITREFLKRRLFWSKKHRLAAWESETRQRFPDLPPLTSKQSLPAAPLSRRPKVSVCMAAYNGAAYIEQQLRSILHQLHSDDEVVIVDDVSRDATVAIIRSITDCRIRLIQHSTNQGVVSTFEDALRNATGDVLFLADDDDIWVENKVSRFLETFQQNPHVSIVTAEVAFIDEHNASMRDNLYQNRKAFRSGFWQNLLRNHFQGSAMALRASILRKVLPFPKRVGFLHDYWIGTRNAVTGGSVICLKEPLLLYRRHPHNFSRQLSIKKQLQVRLQLLWAHFVVMFKSLLWAK